MIEESSWGERERERERERGGGGRMKNKFEGFYCGLNGKQH
jgi:hypothetical protein